MPLSAQDIARVCRCPIAAVEANWPRVVDALESRGLRSDLSEVAAAATIAVETARTFRPINEYGGDAYFARYDGRRDLGNIRPGDGARYHGRGFAQLTGRANYRAAAHVAGCDLEAEPERALDPQVAAEVFAWFFATKRIQEAAAIQDWQTIRRRWNGGLNGWPEFQACVLGLLEVLRVH